jgi:hypothetical protein
MIGNPFYEFILLLNVRASGAGCRPTPRWRPLSSPKRLGPFHSDRCPCDATRFVLQTMDGEEFIGLLFLGAVIGALIFVFAAVLWRLTRPGTRPTIPADRRTARGDAMWRVVSLLALLCFVADSRAQGGSLFPTVVPKEGSEFTIDPPSIFSPPIDPIIVMPLPATWVLMLTALLLALAAYRLFSVPD